MAVNRTIWSNCRPLSRDGFQIARDVRNIANPSLRFIMVWFHHLVSCCLFRTLHYPLIRFSMGQGSSTPTVRKVSIGCGVAACGEYPDSYLSTTVGTTTSKETSKSGNQDRQAYLLLLSRYETVTRWMCRHEGGRCVRFLDWSAQGMLTSGRIQCEINKHVLIDGRSLTTATQYDYTSTVSPVPIVFWLWGDDSCSSSSACSSWMGGNPGSGATSVFLNS